MTSDHSQPPRDEAIRTEEGAKEKRDGEEAEDDGGVSMTSDTVRRRWFQTVTARALEGKRRREQTREEEGQVREGLP